MRRFKKHAELGLRWLRCGWRLFGRNPWLLGGMGASSAVLLATVGSIPLIGSPFIGLLAPALAASFYLAVDGVAAHKAKLPRARRAAALKHAPKELLNVAREESRLLQVVMLGLYSLVAVVLADIVVWLVAGTAWTNRALGTPLSSLAPLIAAGLILLAVYLLLVASLVYALPLALLQRQPLAPAMLDSLRRSARYAYALLPLLALFAAPPLLGGLLSFYSDVAGYTAGLAASALSLPVAMCSLYCSYRTVFPLPAETAALERTPGARQPG